MALVNYEKNDKIVTITLNRPDRLNALSREMVAELSNVWKRYSGDPEARVAILTGSGKVFSVGDDVSELVEPGAGMGAYLRQLRLSEDDGIGGMSWVEKPIITAINGLALGGGCLMVIASDIRIAAKTAALGMPEITLGFYGAADMLVDQGIPFCIAMELVLTGEPIAAQRAYELGLVNKVVPDEEVMPAATKAAERIAELSPLAVKLNKRAGVKAKELNREVLDLRQKIFNKLVDSEDFQEGLRAFTEKRKPTFKGK